METLKFTVIAAIACMTTPKRLPPVLRNVIPIS